MEKEKSLTSIIFPKAVGFIGFIIILLVSNFLTLFLGNQFYKEAINFFNLNIGLLFVILFIDVFHELFWTFHFPFNLLAPVVGSIFWIVSITFVYNLWKFIEGYILSGVKVPIYTIYVLVAIIAFIGGYVRIISSFDKQKKDKNIQRIKELYQKKKDNLEWGDVGEQFKILFVKIEAQIKIILYNIIDALNKVVDDSEEMQKNKSKPHRKKLK